MTEATQTTFFRDFFGKEMSENAGLANQLTTGRARQNDGGYSNDIFPRFFSAKRCPKIQASYKIQADHSPWLKASVPCKWSQVEASGLPHHIIPTLFYFSTAKFSGFDFSPKQKVFSKKKQKVESLLSKSHIDWRIHCNCDTLYALHCNYTEITCNYIVITL